jgi:hypothetical protein
LRFLKCQKNPCIEKDTPIKVSICSNKKYQGYFSLKILISVFEHAPFTVFAKYDPQHRMLMKV